MFKITTISFNIYFHRSTTGILVKISNHDITLMEHDDFNNPTLIQFSDGSRTEYVYTATGEKLRAIHTKAMPFVEVRLHSTAFKDTMGWSNPGGPLKPITDAYEDSTDYIGNFVFENGKPDKYLFSGGYYSYAKSSLHLGIVRGEAFHYYITDHLGNNCVVVSDNDSIEQVTHYYPFGAVYADAGLSPSFQKYKYTGKELDLTHGLNTYDHGARQNYSILGVWDRIDPLCEKYYNVSPYVVCGDNPIIIVDKNGDSIIVNVYGEQLKRQGKDNNVYIQRGKKFSLIGNLNGKVDVNLILANVLKRNKEIAKNKNLLQFVHLVKTGGKWDLKNLEGSLWKYGNENGTKFLFKGYKMAAQDIGNLNFGAVARAYGMPKRIASFGAGLYQIVSRTSKLDWINFKLVSSPSVTTSGFVYNGYSLQIAPPYGDDPIDQFWIGEGYKY